MNLFLRQFKILKIPPVKHKTEVPLYRADFYIIKTEINKKENIDQPMRLMQGCCLALFALLCIRPYMLSYKKANKAKNHLKNKANEKKCCIFTRAGEPANFFFGSGSPALIFTVKNNEKFLCSIKCGVLNGFSMPTGL